MDDLTVSMAKESGARAVITLGGDLLNPGMDPGEVLGLLAGEIRKGTAGRLVWRSLRTGSSLLQEPAGTPWFFLYRAFGCRAADADQSR